MRVGIDIQCLLRPLTGVGHYTLGLLNGLASLPLRDRIVPFYFSRRGGVDLPSQVYRKLAPVGRRLPGRLLSLGWKTIRFPPVDSLIGGMDVYHFPDFVARPVWRGAVVVTIYDLSFRRHPEFVEPKNLKYLEKFVPPSLERAERVIVISEFTKQELCSFYPVPEEKVRVVYGGVDDIFRQPSSTDLAKVKYRYNLPDKYILTVATWEPRKNLLGLLKAWDILKATGKVPEWRLLLVGMKGWLYDGIERQFNSSRGLKGVKALGYVRRSDLPALYRNAGLFVFPSYYEGQGLPPLEAQACGVPVAASRAAALPEVLGEGAAYFDPHDPQDLAGAMLQIISDPNLSARLREDGLKQVQKFTWMKAAEETLEIYRELAEPRS